MNIERGRFKFRGKRPLLPADRRQGRTRDGSDVMIDEELDESIAVYDARKYAWAIDQKGNLRVWGRSADGKEPEERGRTQDATKRATLADVNRRNSQFYRRKA